MKTSHFGGLRGLTNSRIFYYGPPFPYSLFLLSYNLFFNTNRRMHKETFMLFYVQKDDYVNSSHLLWRGLGVRLLFHCRQLKTESSTHINFASYMNFLVVGFNDMFTDGQT